MLAQLGNFGSEHCIFLMERYATTQPALATSP
jgi:hypothetical protein